jgi:uncharacterized surface protein with fasciclin (FAS1) repeats
MQALFLFASLTWCAPFDIHNPLGIFQGNQNQSSNQTSGLPPVTQYNGTLLDYLSSNGSYNQFLTLLNNTGLNDTINSTQSQIAVFAPDDNAFQTLPSWLNESLQNSTAVLPAFQALGLYHISPQSFTPQNFTSGGGGGGNATSEEIEYYNQMAEFMAQEYQSEQTQPETPNNQFWPIRRYPWWRPYPWWGPFPFYPPFWRPFPWWRPPFWRPFQEGNQTGGQSNNTISVPTGLEIFNLTLYQSNQTSSSQSGGGGSSNGTWFVNDAQITSVTNTSTGYVYGISRYLSFIYIKINIIVWSLPCTTSTHRSII